MNPSLEDELRHSNELLRRMFSAIGLLVAHLDHDFNFIQVNEAYARADAHDPSFFVGKNHFDLYPSEDVEAIFRRVVESGKPCQVLDRPFEYPEHPERGVSWWDWSVQPIYGADGRVEELVFTLLDVTERHRLHEEVEKHARALERRVEERTAELRHANNELEAFVYSVSHDLRAPLRAIGGFTEILMRKHGDHIEGEARHLFELVVENVQRMGRMIDDLLALSRADRSKLSIERVDMAALFRRTAEELRALAPAREIRVDVHPLPAASADAGLVRQVVTNLLDNAFKFTRTRAAPLVQVIGSVEGATSRYCVEDNGVGFDPLLAPKLFGVFQRLHPTSSFEGTGVGLALVKRIVERHGGRVWAEGGIDRGARFWFTLPAAPGPR